MKERPIIFSAEMVQAILYERKTQTRRVVKEQPNRVRYNNIVMSGKYGWEDEHGRRLLNLYGAPGDRLWVRESWQRCPHCGRLDYKSSDERFQCRSCNEELGKWKSPMFMFREYSRVTLEITDVRVERLQDISESDAIAEGAPLWIPKSDYLKQYCDGSYRNGFHELWNSINAKRGYPWSSNPFVWVIEFKRLESDA